MSDATAGTKTGAVVVLVGHGAYPQGALAAAEMILGEQQGVHAVGLLPDQDPADLVEEVRGLIGERSEDAPVLLLADLFGGSPANALAVAFLREPGVEMITGYNLPMLLELLPKRKRPQADQVRIALQAGTSGVLDVGAKLRQ